MKDRSPLFALFVVVAVLFTAAFACNDASTPTSNSTANNGSTTSSPAQAPSTPKSIAGTYETTGQNPDGGQPYKADLVVTPRDDVYQFSWTSGSNSYDGVGVMTDSRVAVSYTDGANGKGCGVVLYKVGTDGSLDGKVGYWGSNTMEVEKGTRKSGGGADLEGVYDVAGKNTEGKDYKGKLTVTKSGDGYTFNWEAGTAFSGFGIRAGSYVAVGFGGKQCSFVGYDVQADGTLDGKWGSQGATRFGTETAKPKK